MGLLARILGTELPKISPHVIGAVLGEIERGNLTVANAASALGLSPTEETTLGSLVAKVIGLPEAYPMGALVVLTNVGTAFDTIQAAKGLGFTAVDVTGISQLTCRIRYNKIGTGTLTWQLWNETNAQELGILTDAVAGDNKQGDIVVTPGSPLTGGVKLLRVRVQSSVATDDPVYYGSCLFVRRVGRLTSEDVHGLLLAGESGIPPLNTESGLATRLGI